MKNKIIDKATSFIVRNKKSSEKDIKIYKYGLEALYNLITKTIVILIITYFTKTFKECLLIIIIYTSLRTFAYGLHASSSLLCWITTIPIYIGGSLIIKYYTFSKPFVSLTLMIYTIFVLLWAPADTQKRPLIREKNRKSLKIKSIIVCIIYWILLLLVNNYQIINAIWLCSLIESICICPFTYFITGNTFNNYIYYNQKHGLN